MFKWWHRLSRKNASFSPKRRYLSNMKSSVKSNHFFFSKKRRRHDSRDIASTRDISGQSWLDREKVPKDTWTLKAYEEYFSIGDTNQRPFKQTQAWDGFEIDDFFLTTLPLIVLEIVGYFSYNPSLINKGVVFEVGLNGIFLHGHFLWKMMLYDFENNSLEKWPTTKVT